LASFRFDGDLTNYRPRKIDLSLCKLKEVTGKCELVYLPEAQGAAIGKPRPQGLGNNGKNPSSPVGATCLFLAAPTGLDLNYTLLPRPCGLGCPIAALWASRNAFIYSKSGFTKFNRMTPIFYTPGAQAKWG
jgi:hypothetical protein